jgi:RNA polymerase sigma-70 factor (ECF subfamily)
MPKLEEDGFESVRAIYKSNQHRVYAFAFWMTDNELQAEVISEQVFLRAFAVTEAPTAEMIDHAFVTEVCQLMPLGELTLNCSTCLEVKSVRTNTKRVDLERAVVQLPATERLIYLMHDGDGYSHSRIARTLGIPEGKCKHGLHQARLRLRELLAK